MLGNELTVADVQPEPKVLITPMSMGGSGFEDERRLSYTVALVDSDAPSRDDRSLSPFRHWLVSLTSRVIQQFYERTQNFRSCVIFIN